MAEGERGELWIRGPQVMAGYLNNDEATAATIDADGWLHTGDIAVRDDDGFYSIVDRLKELIKYKGFQVPPAELEALLITHPDVADVAVIGVPDEECGELPKAFVVPGRRCGGRRRADGVRRGPGLAAEAGPPGRAGRRDPEVAVRQDPAPGAQGPRDRIGLSAARRRWCRATGTCPGNHCGSTALRNLLAFHGVELSEEMAFGLGAGACFYYVAIDGPVAVAVHQRPDLAPRGASSSS